MLKTPEENKAHIMDLRKSNGREITEEYYQERYERFMRYIPERYSKVSRNDIPEKVSGKPIVDGEKNGLYIYGSVGCGKTHTLYALKKYYAEKLQLIRVQNLTQVLNSIKLSFGTDDPEDIVNDYVYDDGSCLAFDDIGSEKDTEWTGEQLYRMIDHLYTNKIPCIFTSNLSLKDLASRYGEIQGDRIASRLAEMLTVIHLEGKDRRL